MTRCLIFGIRAATCAALAGIIICVSMSQALAATVENPQAGSVGVEGRIPTAPPKTGATIVAPSNGQNFTRLPITVSGLCPSGLLVKVFANNVFVGSVPCEKNSYSIQTDLFSGHNDLVARVFDSFDQPGPDSNLVSVIFNDSQFNSFGAALLHLSSTYAQRGANPGQALTWPVILSGGTGPYAISADWGDGKAPDLVSQEFTGTVDLKHVYSAAGTYKVVVKATDKNGFSAYLQLVAIVNGAVTAGAPINSTAAQGVQVVSPQALWVSTAVSVPLVAVSFWLGKRYELAALRKHLERG